MNLFQIKACGITRASDALAAAELGADAIGLNFYQPSVRSVDHAQALAVAGSLRAKFSPVETKIVGVFVNHSIDEIAELVSSVGLDVIQLHGDERPGFVTDFRADKPELVQTPVIRAVRVSRDLASINSESLVEEAAGWNAVGVQMILLDAAVPGEFGGTGHQLDWQALATIDLDVPIVLAGGLNAENVRDAIRIARPAAVDVASGIESEPGMKDHELLRRFVRNAHVGFEQTG